MIDIYRGHIAGSIAWESSREFICLYRRDVFGMLAEECTMKESTVTACRWGSNVEERREKREREG